MNLFKYVLTKYEPSRGTSEVAHSSCSYLLFPAVNFSCIDFPHFAPSTPSNLFYFFRYIKLQFLACSKFRVSSLIHSLLSGTSSFTLLYLYFFLIKNRIFQSYTATLKPVLKAIKQIDIGFDSH